MCVCVCVCARACVRACVRACSVTPLSHFIGGSVQLEQTKVSLWCGDTDVRQEVVTSTAESRPLSGRELLRVSLPFFTMGTISYTSVGVIKE